MERVEFVLGFSLLLAIFLGLEHLIAIVILINLPLHLIFKIAGTTLLIWSFYYLMNLHVKRTSKKSVICIWQDPAGRWGCLTNAYKAAVGELKGDSFKCPFFVILRLKLKSGVRNVIVPVDALNPSEYRTLCARLSM